MQQLRPAVVVLGDMVVTDKAVGKGQCRDQRRFNQNPMGIELGIGDRRMEIVVDG